MRIKELLRPMAAACLAALALPGSSLAASVTATGTVTGSTLSATSSATPAFGANLDNGDSTPTYTIPVTTQDTRGTGVGWNETITSTQFSTGGATPYALDTAASSLTGVSASAGTGTNTAASNAVSYPVAVPAGATAPTPVKFFNATAGTGMGKFTITPTIGVFVPQNSYAGTYTSLVTLAIVAGP